GEGQNGGHGGLRSGRRTVPEQNRNVQSAASEPPALQNFGRKSPAGLAVNSSHPSSVTPMECSHWDDRDLSRVTAVQPSERTFTCGLPRFTIGSTVKNMPFFRVAPSPRRP